MLNANYEKGIKKSPSWYSQPLYFFGSSKDDDNDTPDPVVPPTNKELLTAKTWQGGETYQNFPGTRFHYLRGGENTSGGLHNNKGC